MRLRAGSIALAIGFAAGAEGQEPDTLWTGTHEIEARWLHADQAPGLVHFEPSSLRLRLDAVELEPGRSYRFTVIDRSVRRATLRIGANGEVEAACVEPRDAVRNLGAHRTSALWAEARSLTVGGGVLLDDNRLWHIAPLEPPALQAGATSVDTIRFWAERSGFLQSLSGPRVTTLLRDTVIDGRRLWIGKDSARVQYRERLLEPKRSLDSTAVVERMATGTLRGRFLYDPALGLFRTRHDTMAVAGEAVLRLPHGGVHRTPASYERRTRWTLRSPSEQRDWEEEEGRRRRAHSFSILVLPETLLQQRIRGGDMAVVDSLLRAWPDAGLQERQEIREVLRLAGPDVRARLDSLQAEEGGPGWQVQQWARDRVWAGPPLDSAGMALYLRYLRDPGLPFASGIDTDPLYENLSGGLVMYPPTLGAPPERTSCTPAACWLVAAERDAAEPRLRQVALAASFIVNPEQWVDSLLARRDTAAHLLHPAVLLARGVGATWPAAEKRPIPEPGAGWREWQRWTGVDLDGSLRRGSLPPVRWQDSHLYAVRMIERLTGRDIGAELRAAEDTTRNRMGRLVLRTLALKLGALRPSLEEIAAGVLSSDSLDRSEALTALHQRRSERQAADSAVHHQLANQLLAQAIGGDSLWIPSPDGPKIRPLHVEEDPDARTPLYVAAENLPAPLQARWEGRRDVSVISSEEWQRQDPRSAGMLLRVGQATTIGPFAWINLTRTVRTERSPNERPRGWASGMQFTLLRTDDGWRVIQVGEWVV